VEGREGEDILSGGGITGPGPNLARAGSDSPRPYFLFFCSLLLLFLFSELFHIIYKNASKQFKPLTKIF
jgi:hypothetical protein